MIEEVEEEFLVEEAAAEPAARGRSTPTAGRLSTGCAGGWPGRRTSSGGRCSGLLGAGTLDEDSWTDVEDTLLMADLGAGAAAEITERLRAEVAAHGVTDAASARALLRRVLIDAVGPGDGPVGARAAARRAARRCC